MNSEGLVKLVILCLTLIVFGIIALVGLLLWRGCSSSVIGSLITVAATSAGGLGSLLANSGGSVTAKSGGTVEVDKAPTSAETSDEK